MTKLLISTIFAILALANVECHSSEESIKEVAELVISAFNTTALLETFDLSDKVKSKCPDFENKIEPTKEQIIDCLDKIELGSETFCSLIKQNLKKCSKPAIDLFASCLSDEFKDLPSMVEKMVYSNVEEACKSTVEEIVELFNPCLMKKEFLAFSPCNDVKTVIDKNKFPSKSVVCSTLPKARNCLKSHLEASCPNPITKRSSLKFQDATLNSVKEDCKA